MKKDAAKKKMRILFLAADKFPPFRVDVSVLFAKEIVNRGHTIDWLLQSEKPIDHDMETQWQGGRAWVGKIDTGPSPWNRFKLHFYNFLNDFKIFQILSSNTYDMIIVRDKYIGGLIGIVASKLFKTQLVYWLSFPMAEASITRSYDGTAKYPLLYRLRGHFLKNLLYRLILPNAKHVFVQTEEMKRQVAMKGIPLRKMTAVPMAVDTSQLDFVGYQQKNRSNEKVVLYLGALNRFRRIDFVLRVFKSVLEKIPHAKLFLVGGSDVKADELFLQSESKRLAINQSTFITGRLPQAEALEYVKKADVCLSFIYPSPIFNVGSPTKLLEYMAMGKASVANDHPEQREVLAESQAGVCVAYNESAFAEAILKLLQHPEDAEKMGKKGRQYILEKRNYEVTADIVENKLSEICDWMIKP